MVTAAAPAIAADPERVRAFLDELATIGADPLGGWSRLAFGSEERRAHAVFARELATLGARVRTDAVGNTIALLPGRDDGLPALATGSHLDSVYRGGNFDGAAGVAAAVETARILVDEGGLRHPVLVVAFAAEEGARFGVPCIGSRTIAGACNADALRAMVDRDGRTAFECAAEVGLDPAAAATARWDLSRVACFVEVHIEQGAVLQDARAPLGIVTVIGGSRRSQLTFMGVADHSGATPMRLRKDALTAAAEFILEVEHRARMQPTAVATVGRVRVCPNSITTVPGTVSLTLDVRDVDARRQQALSYALRDRARAIATARSIELSIEDLSQQSPVALDTRMRRALEDAARSLGRCCLSMPSGASHDAAHLAPHVPTGMVFVPCLDGISHAPEEFADAADIARAAEVVALAFREADRREGPERLPTA